MRTLFFSQPYLGGPVKRYSPATVSDPATPRMILAALAALFLAIAGTFAN